eukprot:TRINITY_DN8268_c0_g2_i3.p1 TRINITY_DN8268_c0_g2~~TRINITY_DN8268_c0_g2_i3.p1  ORF type:complete len:386 (-),score=41.51 TRINITY_DN8268_c0_g2_i3:26-1183(-)
MIHSIRLIFVITHAAQFADEQSALGFCGGKDLLSRSYLLPSRFPFPPIRLVMEWIPGTCDFYTSNFCSALEEDRHFEPDYTVREAIASFLDGCHWRVCRTLDLGANNGWMSAYMLSMGAHVLAVEPQPDLVEGLKATIALNCWERRGKVLRGFVDAHPGSQGQRPVSKFHWREGGQLQDNAFPIVDVMPLDKVIEAAASMATPEDLSPGADLEIELVKMDADAPEGDWLRRIDQLLSRSTGPSNGTRRIHIETIIAECHSCSALTLYRLQQRHGYHIYLLDMHIDRRFLDARGTDVYQKSQPDSSLPGHLTELYAIRFMRHIYYVQPNLTLDQWRAGILDGENDWHYVLTKKKLLEPRREHHAAIISPSPARRASGYKPPMDGIG